MARPDTPDNSRKMVITMLKGMAMGMADLIPGVSGGTMAYILRIYERLLAAIAFFNVAWVRELLSPRCFKALMAPDWRLLLPLAGGLVLAVIVLTKIVHLPELIRDHPQEIYGLFFGLIGGSIWVLLANLVWSGKHIPSLLFVAGGIIAGLTLVTLSPHSTPDTPIVLFFSGMLAISAMLLPGISGSYILLLLGKYALILEALSGADINTLAPFFGGCVVGLIVFSRAVGWLMHRFPQRMTLIICGLLIGTLYAVWPFQNQQYEIVSGKEKMVASTPYWPEAFMGDDFIAIALMMIGSGAVIWMSRAANRANPNSDPH
ncbi:MAG: DUF368 domain-containing protein [Rickettsiales bacterium]|nr:DUF368 domain-containing protein [Rickettsiales bacterium]